MLNNNKGETRMCDLQAELKIVAGKTAGGAGVGAASYFAALTLTDLQIMASIFAAFCTGIYFAAQFGHTCWKWWQDYHAKK